LQERRIRYVVDMARFATRARFTSWNGTPPLDASGGDQKAAASAGVEYRHINRARHIMAIVQIRHHTEGRAHYRPRVAALKTPQQRA
jgi:hypothetical protein